MSDDKLVRRADVVAVIEQYVAVKRVSYEALTQSAFEDTDPTVRDRILADRANDTKSVNAAWAILRLIMEEVPWIAPASTRYAELERAARYAKDIICISLMDLRGPDVPLYLKAAGDGLEAALADLKAGDPA